MRYTLILPSGKVMVFFVEAVAELYRTCYGGVLVGAEVMEVEPLVA